MFCLVLKLLTGKKKKTLRYLGITHFSLDAILYFSFPNIFKIKNKILVNFSVNSKNGWLKSSKYLKKVK